MSEPFSSKVLWGEWTVEFHSSRRGDRGCWHRSLERLPHRSDARRSAFMKARPRKEPPAAPALGRPKTTTPRRTALRCAQLCSVADNDSVPSPVRANGPQCCGVTHGALRRRCRLFRKPRNRAGLQGVRDPAGSPPAPRLIQVALCWQAVGAEWHSVSPRLACRRSTHSFLCSCA
jgi:hypothetical protein